MAVHQRYIHQLCIEFHPTNFKSSRISYGQLGVRLALIPEEQARDRDAEKGHEHHSRQAQSGRGACEGVMT